MFTDGRKSWSHSVICTSVVSPVFACGKTGREQVCAQLSAAEKPLHYAAAVTFWKSQPLCVPSPLYPANSHEREQQGPDLGTGACSWHQHLAVAAEERALAGLSCDCEWGCCAFWAEMGQLVGKRSDLAQILWLLKRNQYQELAEPWRLWWPEPLVVLWVKLLSGRGHEYN